MTTDHKIDITVKSLVLILAIYVGRIHETIPFISGFPIAKFVFGFSLLLAVLTLKDVKLASQSFFPSSLVKRIFVIFLFAVLSIPGSLWVGGSVDFAFSHFVKLLIFVYLIARFIKNEKDANFLVWWFSIIILVVAGIGAMGHKMIAGRIGLGSTYDPNDLALVLVMSLPIIYYKMINEVGWRRTTLICIVTVVLFIIPLTGSRGGILALATVFIAIIWKRSIRRSVPLIIALALIGTVVIAVTGEEHLERFRSLGSVGEDYNMDAQAGRLEIWKRSLPLIAANPLFGTGGGSFMVADGTTHEFGKWSAAHNSFIQIAVELGIIAFLVHISLIWKLIQIGRNGRMPWLGHGIEVSMYAYCVGGFFLSWAYTYVLYFVIGLGVVLERLSAEETIQALEAHGMDEKQ